MGAKKPKQRVTEYYTSIQYAVCHGVVERLISIRVNDKVVGRCSRIFGPIVYIDNEKLFGGVKKEGGLRGRLAWQSGTDDQLLDAYVASKRGEVPENLPGYRGIATAWFTEMPPKSTSFGISDSLNLGSILGNFSLPSVSGENIFTFLAKIINPSMKGFYWSANQPIIPPVHFRVTRIDRSWLPEIAAIPGDPTLEEYAICIAIDCSLSMGTNNRLNLAKTAAVELLRDIKKSPNAETCDIRIVGWSASVTALQKRNCTPADYDALISFVNGLSLTSGTDFTKAVSGLASFYDGAKNKCRAFVFLTDGEPNNTATADSASNTLKATGAEAYAFNLELTNTTQTAKMDNTAADGVPVIQLANATTQLRNAFQTSATQQIDMNPAHIIRECLVNRVWGLGLPESALDSAMFEAAAQTLFNERFGISMMWTRQAEVQDFIGEILSHIQGTIYVNPMTGKICLKLIRNDYNAAALDILTPSNCTVTSFKRRSPAEVTNEINVTWTNPSSEKEEVITMQSLGSIVANNGEVVPDNRNYYGVRRRGLAAELCARDLAAATAPLSTAEVRANRAFSGKVPGEVVKLTDPENGANEIIMRIMKIDYGYVGSSEVQLTLTEDVFGYAKPRVIEPPVTATPLPSIYPEAPSSVEMITVNSLINGTMSETPVDLVDPQTQVAFLVATDSADTFNYEVHQEVPQTVGDPEFEQVAEYDIIGKAPLAAPLVAEAQSILALPVPVTGSQPKVGGFVIFGENGLPEDHHEVALITAQNETTGEFTISRGMLDTVPWEWPAGTPARYIDAETKIVGPEVTSGVPETFRFHTITPSGILPDDMATVVNYTASDRLYAPARPANVVVEGVAFGALDAIALTTINVSWADRNRLTEDVTLLRWDELGVSPEIGQTTTVRLVDYDTGVTLTDHSGLTGGSFSFPASDRAYANAVAVKVISIRDGYESIQAHSVVLQFPEYLRLLEDSADERGTETGDRRRTED